MSTHNLCSRAKIRKNVYPCKPQFYYKPEDQWSCKRSPDYFPGINTTVKQERILMSIKGCYSVANLQKMMLYNPNLDLVNDNVYTKFGHILSISSQDIE